MPVERNCYANSVTAGVNAYLWFIENLLLVKNGHIYGIFM